MEFGSIDGRKDGEDSGFGCVETFEIFWTRDAFFLGATLFVKDLAPKGSVTRSLSLVSITWISGLAIIS